MTPDLGRDIRLVKEAGGTGGRANRGGKKGQRELFFGEFIVLFSPLSSE